MPVRVRLRLAGLADHMPGGHAGSHAGGNAGLDEIAARHAVFVLLGRGAVCLTAVIVLASLMLPGHVALQPFYLHDVLLSRFGN